jgi:hypothetical protein
MNSRCYVRSLLLISLGIYLFLRVALAGYCSLILQFQDVETKNRLVNLRILPKHGVLDAIDIYCSRLQANENNVIFLGDSQTYGYSRPPQDTCAAILQQMPAVRDASLSVHNLAIIDGRFRDSLQILKAFEHSGRKAACILLSTNPTHFVKAPPLMPDAEFYVPLKFSGYSVFSSLIFARENVFDLTGVSWRNMRKFHPVDLFDDLLKSSETFVLSDVGRAYCTDLDPRSVLPDLVDLINLSRKNADRVIFYTQPRYYADYLKPPYDYGWNPKPVDDAVLAAARELNCDVALDLSDAFPRDHFSDLIHLNQRGHEALAKTLLPHIIGGSQP